MKSQIIFKWVSTVADQAFFANSFGKGVKKLISESPYTETELLSKQTSFWPLEYVFSFRRIVPRNALVPQICN